MHEELNLSGWQ